MSHIRTNAIVYLLCGLPGTGKTTYAKNLQKETHFLRISFDEEFFTTFTHDVPQNRFAEYEAIVEDRLVEVIKNHLKNNVSLILDFGLWKRERRDFYKKLVEDAGGTWKLLYLTCSRNTMWDRVNKRNALHLPYEHTISKKLLETFVRDFEEPRDEDEQIVMT